MNPDGLIILLNKVGLENAQLEAQCRQLADENQMLRAALAQKEGAESASPSTP